MAKIRKIIAREILDSRGSPTVEVIIQLSDDSVGIFSTPSGASVGKYEAKEVRDGDLSRYAGLGVLKALSYIVSDLAPLLVGKEAEDQMAIDKLMTEADGSKDKSKFGANSILAISGAVAKAQAISSKMPVYQYIAKLLGGDIHQFVIPTPMFNILNGGRHAGNNLDFQEFLIVPPQAKTYSQNLKFGSETYIALKETIKAHSGSVLLGDEGGYAPTLYANIDAFKILEEAVVKAGYAPGLDAFFSVDVAAANLKRGNSYKIKDRPVELTANDFLEFYVSLNEQFHLLSIEDPFNEDDWDQWKDLTKKFGTETLIVGDDLICTNLERLKKASGEKACNAVIVKPNQVGTITEALEVTKEAKHADFKVIVSHRSGETNDDFIADFAVGVGADYAKLGAPARGERVAKYNRLLEIEHELS